MTSPEAGADKRVALAAVAGAHGIKGEVRLKLFSDSVASLATQPTVLIGGRTMRLLSARDAGKTVIARIEGIADRTAAEALRGSLIEIDRDALPPLGYGEYYHADLIGIPCVDDLGNMVGTVSAIENFGAGDLVEVEMPSGRKGLVPFRDPIARLDDGRIVIDPEFLA
jgi:16S rRNA processing protein RimM